MMWRFSSYVLLAVFQRESQEEYAQLPRFAEVDAKSTHMAAVAHGMKVCNLFVVVAVRSFIVRWGATGTLINYCGAHCARRSLVSA